MSGFALRCFGVAVALAFSLCALPVRAEVTEAAQLDSRAAYDRGVRLYDLGDFGGAVVEFKRAYELAETPALLFNIAQCHYQLNFLPDALFMYESYLRASPRALNREDVEQRIAELKRRIKPTQIQYQANPEPVSAPHDLLRAPPNRARIAGGITATTIGVVLLATGAALFGRSDMAGNRLTMAPKGAAWDEYFKAIDADRRTSRTSGAVLLSVGLGSIVAGSTVAALAFRTPPRPAAAKSAARF